MNFKDKIKQRDIKETPKRIINADIAKEAIGNTVEKPKNETYVLIDIDKLYKNPYQPRKKYEQENIKELANSLKTEGLLQPIVITPHPIREKEYFIVYGHRRVEATKFLNVKKIKAIVRHLDEKSLKLTAIIENIQRKDLSIIEEANAFLNLKKDGLTDEEIANEVGKSRVYINKTINILKLPKEILQDIERLNLKLSKSFLHEIVSLPTDILKSIWKLIVKQPMTIKELREIAKSKCSTSNSSISTSTKNKIEKYNLINYKKTNRTINIRLSLKKLKEKKEDVIGELKKIIEELENE